MKSLGILVLPFLLFACKTQNLLVQKHRVIMLDSTFQYDPGYQYRIRIDDKVNISVWGQDELSVGSVYGIYNSNEVYGKWLLVDQRGKIELPKFGTFEVKGYTIPDLKDTLRNIYKKWIVNPVVDVKVMNKQITVMGEVRNPSVIQVDKDHNTLLEMIARTGGFEFYANLKNIKILRQEGQNVRVANIDLSRYKDLLAQNIQLHPGDVVIVSSKGYKNFDKRIATIIPLTTTVTAAAILMTAF